MLQSMGLQRVDSTTGSSVHGIFQARILKQVAFSYSGDLPNPEIEPTSFASPALAGRFSATSATWETPCIDTHLYIHNILMYYNEHPLTILLVTTS